MRQTSNAVTKFNSKLDQLFLYWSYKKTSRSNWPYCYLKNTVCITVWSPVIKEFILRIKVNNIPQHFANDFSCIESFLNRPFSNWMGFLSKKFCNEWQKHVLEWETHKCVLFFFLLILLLYFYRDPWNLHEI